MFYPLENKTHFQSGLLLFFFSRWLVFIYFYISRISVPRVPQEHTGWFKNTCRYFNRTCVNVNKNVPCTLIFDLREMFKMTAYFNRFYVCLFIPNKWKKSIFLQKEKKKEIYMIQISSLWFHLNIFLPFWNKIFSKWISFTIFFFFFSNRLLSFYFHLFNLSISSTDFPQDIPPRSPLFNQRVVSTTVSLWLST